MIFLYVLHFALGFLILAGGWYYVSALIAQFDYYWGNRHGR